MITLGDNDESESQVNKNRAQRDLCVSRIYIKLDLFFFFFSAPVKLMLGQTFGFSNDYKVAYFRTHLSPSTRSVLLNSIHVLELCTQQQRATERIMWVTINFPWLTNQIINTKGFVPGTKPLRYLCEDTLCYWFIYFFYFGFGEGAFPKRDPGPLLSYLITKCKSGQFFIQIPKNIKGKERKIYSIIYNNNFFFLILLSRTYFSLVNGLKPDVRNVCSQSNEYRILNL